MRRPMMTMPCPMEWRIGSHIQTNVSVKVPPVGGPWADVEEIEVPEMAPETAREPSYLPSGDEDWEEFEDVHREVFAESLHEKSSHHAH